MAACWTPSYSWSGEIQQQQDKSLHVLGKNFMPTSPVNISVMLSDLENDRILYSKKPDKYRGKSTKLMH